MSRIFSVSATAFGLGVVSTMHSAALRRVVGIVPSDSIHEATRPDVLLCELSFFAAERARLEHREFGVGNYQVMCDKDADPIRLFMYGSTVQGNIILFGLPFAYENWTIITFRKSFQSNSAGNARLFRIRINSVAASHGQLPYLVRPLAIPQA